MKNIVRAIISLVVMVGIIYFAVNAIRHRSYSGSEVEFTTSGTVELVNSSDEPLEATLTSRTRFTINASDPDLEFATEREGSGRNAVYKFEGELPSGDLRLEVVRGDVTFSLKGDSGVQATVIPQSSSSERAIIIIAIAACMGILGYMSFSTEHAWFGLVRRSVPMLNARKASESAK